MTSLSAHFGEGGSPIRLRPGRRLPWTIALAVLGASVTFAFAVPVAHAGEVHALFTSFALPDSAGASEVAINQSTGEVYVSAAYNQVVDALEASGAPDPVHPELTEANGITPYPFPFPDALAVDNSGGPDEGDIYVSEGNGAVLQFDPSGARTAQAPISVADVPTVGTSQASRGLPPVVNNGGFSPGGLAVASNGDVYVADDSNNVVDVFEPDGAFVSQLASGLISGPGQIAIGPSNNLYVTEGAGLIEFELSGACVNSCTSISRYGTSGVAVDGESSVYADEQSSMITEFQSGVGIENFGAGIGVGGSVAVNDANGSVYVESYPNVYVYERTTAPTIPTIDVTSSSGVTQTTAVLQAQVNPDFGSTVYRFQYGTTSSYGSSTPISQPIGTDNTDHLATAAISNLSPSTTYHYRVVAINFAGTTHGPDETFTTPGQVVGGGGAAVGASPATAPVATTVPTKQCRKGFVERHDKCVKKARHKAKQHKKHKAKRKTKHHKRGGTR